jgi:transcriptional regulator with XRE-family HTH domain
MVPAHGSLPTDQIDRHVGARLRQRGLEVGLTTAELERRLEVTAGTLDRFKDGLRPIGSAALFRLGRALDVAVDYFFDGLPTAPPRSGPDHPDPASDPDAARLPRRFESVTDPDVRKNLLRLVKSIADGDFDWD